MFFGDRALERRSNLHIKSMESVIVVYTLEEAKFGSRRFFSAYKMNAREG